MVVFLIIVIFVLLLVIAWYEVKTLTIMHILIENNIEPTDKQVKSSLLFVLKKVFRRM